MKSTMYQSQMNQTQYSDFQLCHSMAIVPVIRNITSTIIINTIIKLSAKKVHTDFLFSNFVIDAIN